jgi:hypothetical protein
VSYRYTYHDDPLPEIEESTRSISKPKIFLGLIAIAGIFFQTTLAANISLTSNGATEFGQGVQQTIFCGGNSTVVTIKPSSAYSNSQGSGTYYVDAIDVSGIPAECDGVDFTIQAFDSATSTALPLVNSVTRDLVIYNNAGTFKAAVEGVTTSSSSGSFRATMLAPFAIPNNIYRFAIQTSKHSPSCWTGDATSSCTPSSGIKYGSDGGSPTGYLTMSTGFSAGDTFTVEAWVKAANMAQENTVVIIGAGANNYALTVRNTSASQWSVDMSGFARMNFDLPSGTMANNTWHHVVAVRDADGISMWVNGTRLNYATGSCGASCVTTGNGTKFNRSYTTASTQIGAWSNNSWFSKGGVINYLRLSNVALYPSTQSSITVPTGVPTSSASTKLLMTQASISPPRDYSGLAQTLTPTGTVAVTN